MEKISNLTTIKKIELSVVGYYNYTNPSVQGGTIYNADRNKYLVVKATFNGLEEKEKIGYFNFVLFYMGLGGSETLTFIKFKDSDNSLGALNIKFNSLDTSVDKTLKFNYEQIGETVGKAYDLTSFVTDVDKDNNVILFAVTNNSLIDASDAKFYNEYHDYNLGECVSGFVRKLDGVSNDFIYEKYTVGRSTNHINLASGKNTTTINLYSGFSKKVPINLNLALDKRISPNYLLNYLQGQFDFELELKTNLNSLTVTDYTNSSFYFELEDINSQNYKPSDDIILRHLSEFNHVDSVYYCKTNRNYIYFLTDIVMVYDSNDNVYKFKRLFNKLLLLEATNREGHKVMYNWDDSYTKVLSINSNNEETLYFIYDERGVLTSLESSSYNRKIELILSSTKLEYKMKGYLNNISSNSQELLENFEVLITNFNHTSTINKITNESVELEYDELKKVTHVTLSIDDKNIASNEYYYGKNYTRIKNHEGKKVYYYFDHLYRLRFVTDKNGINYSNYYDLMDLDSVGARSRSSRRGGHTRNLLLNGNFKENQGWNYFNCVDIPVIEYCENNNKCLKVTKKGTEVPVISQNIYSVYEGKYKIKGFIKRQTGASIVSVNAKITLTSDPSNSIYKGFSNFTKFDEWEEFVIENIDIPENGQATIVVSVNYISGTGNKSIFLRDFRFGNVKHFNKVNLIENGYMDFLEDNSDLLKGWSSNNSYLRLYREDLNQMDHPKSLGEYVLKIPKDNGISSMKRVSYLVNKSGVSNHRFNFSVYGKGYYIGEEIFRSYVKVNYTNKNPETYYFNFERYVEDWQNNINSFVTTGNYSSLEVGVEYNGFNDVFVDCVQLYEDCSNGYIYNNSNNIISELVSESNSVQIMRDKNNLIDRCFTKDGNAYRFVYDEKGRLIKIIDSFGDGELFEYDNNGNLSKKGKNVPENSLSKEEFSYDEKINLTTHKDSNNITLNIEYDDLNRIIKERVLTNVKAYDYYTNDLLKNIHFGKNDAYDFTYNHLYNHMNQLEKISTPTKTYEYEYDEVGRLNKIKRNNEEIIRYTYVEKEIGGVVYYTNLISKETYVNNYEYEYEYNEDNLIKAVKLENEVVEEYEYDEFGNVICIKTEEGETKLEYDGNNTLVRVERPNNKVDYYKEKEKVEKVVYQTKGKERTIDYIYSNDLNEKTIGGYLGRLCNKFKDEILLGENSFNGIYGGRCVKLERDEETQEFTSSNHYALCDIDTMRSNVEHTKWKEEYSNNKTFMMMIKPKGEFSHTNLFKVMQGDIELDGTMSLTSPVIEFNITSQGKVAYKIRNGSETSLTGTLQLNKWNFIGLKFNKSYNGINSVLEVVINGQTSVTTLNNLYYGNPKILKICDCSNNELVSGTTTCKTRVEVDYFLVGAHPYSINEMRYIYEEGNKYYNGSTSIVREQGIVTYPSKLYEEYEVITLNGTFESSKGRKPELLVLSDDTYKNMKLRSFEFINNHFVYKSTGKGLNKPILKYDFRNLGEGQLGVRFKVDTTISNISYRTLLSINDSNNQEMLTIRVNSNGTLTPIIYGEQLDTIGVNVNYGWNTLLIDFNEESTSIILNGAYITTYDMDLLDYGRSSVYVGYSSLTDTYFEGYIEMLCYSDTSYWSSGTTLLSQTQDFFNNGYPIVMFDLYDGAGRKTSKNVVNKNGYNSIHYTWDNNLLTKEEESSIYETNYTYDDLGRLIGIETLYQGNESNIDETYTYDDYSRISSYEDSTDRIEYQYSNDDISKVKYFSNNQLVEELTYNYDPNNPNRLLSVIGTTKTISLEYNPLDKLGYPTKINNNILEWSRGRLVRYGDNVYTYNESGYRTRKQVGQDVYDYYLEGNKVIRIDKNNNLLFNFLYDCNNQLLGLSYNNKEYYYKKDVTGTIIGIIDSNHNLVVQYKYTPYGALKETIVLSSSNDVAFLSINNPFLFKGYYYDVETQLYWVSSRYYSPELCRWISPDSIEYLDPESINGLNLYAYCNNDPVNLYDPSGHAPEWLQGLAIGLAIVGAVLVIGAVTVLTCGVGTLAGTMAGAVIYGAAQGIAIGAAVGVVGGGIVGGIASDWSAEGILIGMGIGLGAGAIVGGVIGGFAGASSFTANSAYISQYGGNVKEVLSAYKGNPRLKVLNSNTTAYRTWGGTSGKFGHWISPKNYGSAARSMLSLPPGNTAANTSQFLISKGSTVLSGKAAALFGQTGGGIQWWIGLL